MNVEPTLTFSVVYTDNVDPEQQASHFYEYELGKTYKSNAQTKSAFEVFISTGWFTNLDATATNT